MKIFLDTIDIDFLKEFSVTGLIDGITTNPLLLSKSNLECYDLIVKICSLITGPVSIEVISTSYKDMIKEGLEISRIAGNVVVKLPLTYDGLIACKVLSCEHNVKVNVTLCFSVSQAILAAKAGAYFISPFVGRIDDIGQPGMQLIKDIRDVYSNYNAFNTEILVASVRNITHVIQSAKIGADIVTIPPSIFKQMFMHPLTNKGLEDFLQNWNASGKKIFS
ncbi:transaldolase family protein [Ehrlichia chaffeensis str. Heartland]|uniref:Transaldolase n=1 Tax=Ehrlichia chaffeensis (strain ATCC CRL-10679 / Arkansas) TaxID=205920 RepID=Q2GGP7_EHRCR|nr:transaldolase family protein [Ehrlichia chaffeensis]ABD45102.1 putative transaldolase [Ehrlichia chaffeensis str. Arkansas]AHX03664.1 transaldolase family protein [Ehrlichia chaffeensis str. Heartland]AHX05615.1 transaldolase family protein [Ehrlichia chaffeensis str. Jax]AHX06606.1 transaldolase family protein [Ehrlichia chaffeensis str. Liberty]AHX07651.1 transaldolase family protein [Ehrlichia chaffeensis str. Osceola]